jgi:two-component system, NtrC family, response regulator HydG
MKPTQIQLVVIDDDLDMQDMVTAFFKTKDYKISRFSDAETALKASAKNGSAWDVVLTDLKLPGMSGVDFTKEVKKNFPNLPIILITTTRSAEVALEAVKHGAYDFIVKPIHFPQLQISVERALNLKSLRGDLDQLRTQVKVSTTKQGSIIGKSPKFVEALDIARRVAKSKASILITGDSGTGKEVFAKFIHQESTTNKGPFVAINCSAIPENLLESELFGHAKGAFTGAADKKIGLFEEAENGTLFLDEIGDLSGSLQAKLLRVLQEKKIKRLGENQDRSINCRVISATHKNLQQEIRSGKFREDLFFRLNVIPIKLPTLKERKEDLIPLAESFLKKFAIDNNSTVTSFSKEALRFILDGTWRGNVRELENAIERAVVLAKQNEIQVEDMISIQTDDLMMTQSSLEPTSEQKISETNYSPEDLFSVFIPNNHLLPLENIICKYIDFAVHRNGGAKDKTARDLFIDRKTLYKKLKQSEALSHQAVSFLN